ncbi:hypothetical protein PR202_gb21118 [Eleusine coracana subsp. coracana]|uniref:Protein kinase domain-containing protein n=1 Tax=Eleusine coracana subsp. coracana TaxID=191504 RepID=A0AAV5FD70_ELECO|nr:hypothetical protein PR202_gb21118 [Eleusine coracana subsp. coracana]
MSNKRHRKTTRHTTYFLFPVVYCAPSTGSRSVFSFYRDATIYYNPCMLHYSDVHSLPDNDTGPTSDSYPIINNGNVTSDPERFNEILTALVNATANYAVFNSTRRFATREADFKHGVPQDPRYPTEAEDVELLDSMIIDVSTLRTATGNFDDSNKLGEGGFGAVYKGVLPCSEEIAVKRLSDSSTQGVDELKNELALVAKVKHKNLVRLVGVCLEEQERLLVYDYVPNRSLDPILFGADENEERREQLDWEQRYRIISGIARGLQ